MTTGKKTTAASSEEINKPVDAAVPAKAAKTAKAAKPVKAKAEAAGDAKAPAKPRRVRSAKAAEVKVEAKVEEKAPVKPRRVRPKSKSADKDAAIYRPLFPVDVRIAPDRISGAMGLTKMVPIGSMRVDESYQRVISGKSHRVIREICEEFDWRKFLPMILVARPDGMYDIVDGQHRATAALTLGMTELPSYVIEATRAEAAGAFAAINGSVTQVSPQDVWFAQITAGDPSSLKLKAVLDRIGITIVRHSSVAGVAETASIAVLRRAWTNYDEDVFEIILHAIVHTGDGNPGMIMGSTVNGIGHAIRKKAEIHRNPRKLYEVMEKIRLRHMVVDARIESARTGNPIQFILTREFNKMLRKA